MTTIIHFFQSIWNRFFGVAAPDHYVPIPREPFEAPIAIVADVPPKRKRIPRAKTLKALLENIEYSFESIGCPTDWKWAHTNKDTVTGLKRLGPHINIALKQAPTLPDEIKISTLNGVWGGMMFVAYEKKEVEQDFMKPVFSYAVLLKKAPWFIEQKQSGLIYECGAAWRDSNDKLFWGNWYVAVNKASGAIKLLTYLRYITRSIKDGRYSKCYSQKIWAAAPMTEASFCIEKGRREDVLKEIFMHCFESWQIMDSQWKVSVTKSGQRITWTVPQNETKHYFADRDTTITDRNGKKKKIIHHVEQHERLLANGTTSVVREHIRGLGHFEWRGYDVDVIAPKFHVTAQEWNIAGSDEDDITPGDKVIFSSKLGQELSRIEKRKLRKPLPPIH